MQDPKKTLLEALKFIRLDAISASATGNLVFTLAEIPFANVLSDIQRNNYGNAINTDDLFVRQDDGSAKVYVDTSPDTANAIKELRRFLGASAEEVTPVFALEDGCASLVSLKTGPFATQVDALNKLNKVLKENAPDLVKTAPAHDFSAEQTAAIVKALTAKHQGVDLPS